MPTLNNAEYLRPAVVSVLRNRATAGLFKLLIINNGHPDSVDYLRGEPDVEVINSGGNIGWEGAIMMGFNNSKSPFVVFINDDILVPMSSKHWINQMLQHFKDPKVAAVGPSSNTVMGFQNIFTDVPFHVFESRFLIGYCVMMRRSAFKEIGGMDMSLPGGDDLDWSIRLREAGYKLLVDRTVFIYHHGFKTGEKVNGPASTTNGWNSYEMYSKTNTALIKKHGFKKWWDVMKGSYTPPTVDYESVSRDTEGEIIKSLVKGKKTILDLGCGPRKTLSRAIGIDLVKKGQQIHTLEGVSISQADIEADIAKGLPVKDNSADVIIARHILEHLVDHITALGNWIQKLKSGGKLIIAVPNQEWHLTIPMNIEHVHAFTPQSLGVLLSSMGLKNIEFMDSKNNISFIAVAEK